MSKAVRIHATGGADRLVYESVEVGEPGPGEVRLRLSDRGKIPFPAQQTQPAVPTD